MLSASSAYTLDMCARSPCSPYGAPGSSSPSSPGPYTCSELPYTSSRVPEAATASATRRAPVRFVSSV